MSGFMRKAALVVGAVALVAATAGAAAPLLAPGMAGAAGIAGVSAATLTAIGTYGGLAAGVLTAISTATAPGMSSQGSQTSFTTNPQSGLPYAMGRTRMSGLRIYANTNTRPGYTKFNDLLWFGALLSIGGAIGGIEKFTADNEIVTFDASGNAIGDYHDYQAQKIHLGGQQTSALALTLVGGSAPGWTTSHKLSGITHAMWCLRYNKQGEMYGAGAPEPAWIGNWVKVYDPRLDSTYPGGSGSCRALVESTYVWSDNPGLHALTWALGRWQNGKRTCGIGAPVANIRVAEFVECANVCEANGWKIGGVEWTTDSKWDTLKRILQAGGAIPTQTGAMVGCLVSTPRTAIATIESRHLLDSLSIAATKSRRDRFNSVIPRYVDEDSDWSVISGTAITVSDYVTADKGQRTKEIDYPLVQVFSGQVAKQPGQLAAYDIVNSREAGPINFTTGPEWIGLKTGDVILLNVPEEGLVNQPVLITRRAPDPSTGKVAFSAQTETYAKHAYALGQSTTPPAPFSLTAPDLKPPAPAAANWAAAGTVTGEGLPAIVVTGNSEMPSADAVLIDYKLSADATWTRSAILSANEPVQHVIAPLQSETAYQIRVGYRVEQIDGDFTILAAVTTGVGIISDISDTIGEQQDQLEQLEQDTAAAQANIAAAQAQIAAIESSVSADFSQVNAALSTLNGEVDTAQSNITSLQSSTSSLNTAVTTLQGEVSTAQTNISSLQSQAAGIISDVDGLEAQIIAQGGQISTLQTTMSSQGAQISTLQTTVSNAVGDVATLKTQINAGGGNLLVNTDFGLDTSGWIFTASGGNGSVGLRNAPDAQWYPPNENTIVIQQNNTTSTGYADWTQTIEVAATKWHDVSVYAASHRCPIQIYLMWLDSAGAAIGSAPSIGPFGPAGGGNTLASFPVRSFKAQAPTGAVRARLYLRKFGTNSGTTDSWAWFLRPQVAEVLADTATPIAYSPGSARSTISVQATALSSLTTTVSTLSTTVSTQGGSISTLQSSVTTLQGSVTTLQTTVSTQGTNITSLQTAVSTAQGDLATLKTQVTAGGGNLLVNTDFAIDTSGWSTSLQNSTVADRVPSGDQWMVTGENGLRLFQPNGTTTGYSEWSAFTAVEAGKWYDVSVYAAAHRCQVQIYLQWVDSAGESPLGAPSSGLMSTLTGGNLLGNWTRIGFKAQAPVGAVRARFILRKFGTLAGASEANSYAWFLRPQVAETLATSATPIAYAPGSARAVIETQAQALSTATSSLAALSTTVSTQGGSISTLQSSMTSAQGSISTLQSTVSTQGGQISTLQSTSSTQAGQISTLQSTVSTQGGSISTMQSTLTTLQGTVSMLSTVVTASSNPNVLPNGGFENQLKGWTGSGSTGAPTSGWFQANNGSWGFYAANNTAWTGSSTLQFSTLNSDLISGIDAGATFTVAADADIRANSAGAEAWVQIIWVTSSGTVYSDGPHRSVETGFGFDPSGASRVTFKATYAAPANVTNMRVSLVVSAPPGVTVTGTAWRQVKLERGSLATPYSGEATAAQMYQAYSTLDTSFASLSTTVSTQGGSISTLQSSMTSAQGSISTLQSTVSTQGGQISTLQSTSSTQAGQISTLQSTVSTQGGSISTLQSSMTTAQGNISTLQSTVSAQGTSISTLQSAVSTAQGDLATLKTQVTAGGGNLLVNTDAAVDISGWSTGGAMTTGAVFGINIAGDAYRPVPDNNLSIQQTNTDSSGYQEYTQQVAVEANKWYYSSVYAASHRCSTALYVLFFDSSGAAISGAGLSVSSTGAGTGGNTLAAYALMSGKAQAPADAVTARFYLRKFSTLSGQTPDSYAWFCRPQLAETTANATTPPAYAPGSARATIQMQASALSTLTTQYASLSSSVSVQGASITAQSIAISTLNGNVAALFAKSSLMIEAGNVITGWENSTNGQTSSFRIRADIFELVPSNGSGARTEYSNGNWRVYHPNGVLATRNGVW